MACTRSLLSTVNCTLCPGAISSWTIMCNYSQALISRVPTTWCIYKKGTKLTAVITWPTPTTVRAPQSFLGTSFYRRFIRVQLPHHSQLFWGKGPKKLAWRLVQVLTYPSTLAKSPNIIQLPSTLKRWHTQKEIMTRQPWISGNKTRPRRVASLAWGSSTPIQPLHRPQESWGFKASQVTEFRSCPLGLVLHEI